MPAISLLALPDELLLEVGEHCLDLRDMNALARTNKRSYQALNSGLYSADAGEKQHALSWAARHGLKRTAELSLAANGRATIDPISYDMFVDPLLRSMTPLQISICLGNEEVACLLLAKGADISSNNTIWEDPVLLHVASALGMPNAVELLVERGASLEAPDLSGRTPLHYAVSHHPSIPKSEMHVRVVRVLLAHGARHATKKAESRSRLSDVSLWTPHSVCVDDVLHLHAEDHGMQGGGGDELAAERQIRDLLEAKQAESALAMLENDRAKRQRNQQIQEQKMKRLAAKEQELRQQRERQEAIAAAELKDEQRRIAEGKDRGKARIKAAHAMAAGERANEEGREKAKATRPPCDLVVCKYCCQDG